MPQGIKIHNEYADELGSLYDRIPKAVLAAIAVSYATGGGDHLEQAQAEVWNEWRVLHRNGIVPQPPVKL